VTSAGASTIITVGDLRAAIVGLPDAASIIIEGVSGWKYDVIQAFAIGTKTDDLDLVLRANDG